MYFELKYLLDVKCFLIIIGYELFLVDDDFCIFYSLFN